MRFLLLLLSLTALLVCVSGNKRLPLGTPLQTYGVTQCSLGEVNETLTNIGGVTGFEVWPSGPPDNHPNIFFACDPANLRFRLMSGELSQFTFENGTYTYINAPPPFGE